MYDRDDAHYDTISAFIKSMRGSDPDAAVYYLASMIAGGEDPKFIARRMIVFASEDVGNADPQALQVAVAAARAVEFVGLARVPHQPEPGGDLPGAGAQEQRRLQGDRRGAGRRAPRGQPAAAAAPARAPTTAARRNSATARGTSTRTRAAAGSRSSTCPTSSQGAATTCRYEGSRAELAARWEEIRRRGGVRRRRRRRGGEAVVSGVYVWILVFLVVALVALRRRLVRSPAG